MIWAGLAFIVGMILIVTDWRMSTPPDPKTKRRPPLKPADKGRLRQMFYWTIGVTLAVYFLPGLFD